MSWFGERLAYVRKGIYIIPNSITLCGMTLGFYAILSALKGDFTYAAWFILLAIISDALDGWVARLTTRTRKVGEHLADAGPRLRGIVPEPR